ncbi:MAG TPA: response regulator [Opitutaceae bacterium]|nr:response regulator [Opitutaceae bacterium]
MEKKYILVISDQPVICDVLRRLLAIDGNFVLTASDCDEGLVAARLFPFNLIVLDMDLDKSSSDAARAKLKHEAVTVHLPVVLISARLPARDLQKSDASTETLFSMPFSLTEIRDAVNRLLQPAD